MRQQIEGSLILPSLDTCECYTLAYTRETICRCSCSSIIIIIITVFRYSRDNSVGGNDVLHLLGPGIHEAEPPAPQRDEGAVFDLELVTVGVDLLSHLEHCGKHIHSCGEREHPLRTLESHDHECPPTLSVALCQVANVVLVEILIKRGSKQLLGQVSEDGRGSAGTH